MKPQTPGFVLLLTTALVMLSSGCAKQVPLNDGMYAFEHRFAEAEHQSIKSVTLLVTINGDRISVTNNDRFDVFPEGVLEAGTVMWHRQSGQWIIGHSKADAEAAEVGGCSGGPTVIDLVKKIYWTC